MKEVGKVISVDGHRVRVEVEKTSACSGCGKCGHISFGENSLMVEAAYEGDIRPGDLVELEISDSDYLRLSFLLYLLPLISLGVGYLVGHLIGAGLGMAGVMGAFFGAGFMALSYYWLRQYDKTSKASGRYLPFARPLDDPDWS